jgi:autotransporter strand-loop-strand O-heptosyltransferase
MGIQVVAHTSYLGHTGYNAHSRNFFTHLNKFIPTRVRNYSGCDDLSYLKPEEYNLIIQQNLNGHQRPVGLPFKLNPKDTVVDIVLNESHHYFFYDKYEPPMIAYNVWESTKQLPQFFDRILEYDQFWCPTEWQRKVTIEQGYPEDRVKVVPEAVSPIFLPNDDMNIRKELFEMYNIPSDAFVCMIFGRWDRRKSTEEMIRAWRNVFGKIDNCYLVISVDNPFSSDNLKTTEDRLEYHGLEDDRIRILHFPPREEYIKWLQHGNCLLSCSRAEGWNIPLIEAIACGTPTICSNWGAHLEFADGISYLVDVPNELPPKEVYMLGDEHDLGVWGEPDYDHLEYMMKKVYNEYTLALKHAMATSKYIRKIYTWENAARIGSELIENLVSDKYHYVKNVTQSKTKVSFVTSFYNAEQYIDDLYPTVLNQTIDNWEWIVTDDFSDDNTKEKVLEMCKLDSRIKYINQKEKQEIYWNPHKYANGDYILTIDADDQIFPKTAEVIAHMFDTKPDISCVHVNANYYYNTFDSWNFKNSSFCDFTKHNMICTKHPEYLKNESGYERVGFMFGTIRAYRNPGPEFNFNRGYKLGRHEDLAKLLRLEEMGPPLYLNRTLYKVRMREDSNSGSWGDKGGETEFDRMYGKDISVYPHDPCYDDAREILYSMLYSDLNDEKERKKISIIGVPDELQNTIKEVYYDHDIFFGEFKHNSDYVFIILHDIAKLTLHFAAIKTVNENCKVTVFMKNDDWEPSFYDVEDSSNYFPLYNDTKNFLHGKVEFSYTTYLYKYCTITFKVPERKRVKLNIGCGNDIRPDYINIDKYNNTGQVDHQWDLGDIRMPDNSVDEIFTSHVFEHIPINEVYGVLEEWERVLLPGGKLVLHLPNLETEVRIWLDTPDDRKWFEVHRIFGSQSHEGNTHFNGHNPESLKSLIERFNFKVLSTKVGNSGFGEEIQLIAEKIQKPKMTFPVVNCHFVDGPFCEVKGDSNDNAFYIFDFLDPDNNSSVHQQMMGINTWTRPHRKFFTNWLIQVHRNGRLIYNHNFNAEGKNVLISFDSKSLGDTIAWVPQVEEFRKKHNCYIILSTFWNHLFKDSYPDIEFIKPGKQVGGLYASYQIGCFTGERFKQPQDWRTIPLQQVASDILGLEYKEKVCDIGIKPGPRPIEEKYVAISEFSTFQCKFWNYENGWQEIVDYLNSLGYPVMSISSEDTKLNNVIKMNGKPIEETITNIAHAEFFIGISSGPSWLAWALKRPTILISGYSAKWAEFETNCERIINEDVCHGCFNRPDNNFDKGNWNWCPFREGTSKQFECSKTITPDMVKKSIQKIITKR